MSFSRHSILLRIGLLIGFAFAVLTWATNSASAQPNEQSATLTGRFQIMWGDPAPGSGLSPTTTYYLTDDRGVMTLLALNENVLRAAGGALALNGQRVTIAAQRVTQAPGETPERADVQQIQRVGAQAPSTVIGTSRWISILCKFADIADEGRTLAYFQNMYSSSYPGLDHYWRELSYDKLNLMGSGAVGWVTLPHPEAYYMDGSGNLILGSTASDCAAAADSQVDFRNYDGVNLMLNGDLGMASWGGTSYLSQDGANRYFRTTWMAGWAWVDLGVVEHEMGHGFGLPHSYNMNGDRYSAWDVMSDVALNCGNSWDPVYQCLGQHTISEFKYSLGWLTYYAMVFPGQQETVNLDRLALPPGSSPLEARVFYDGSHYYTVEARMHSGYDVKLPGEGVIIHKVDTTNGLDARVVDPDNGAYNGAGAIWSPGEVFADPANGIYVCVNSQTPTGYNVTVASGVVPACGAIPTPTNTPRPGNVLATSATTRDYNTGALRTFFNVGEIVAYYGDYSNSSSESQNVKVSYDVVGPCGSIFHWVVTNSADPPTGTMFSSSPIPSNACPGLYTFTFSITYNTVSSVSTTFTVVAPPTATPMITSTPTKTATGTPTNTPTQTATSTPTKTATCGTAANPAQFVSQSVPTLLAPGQKVAVSVTMKNTGTATWPALGTYRLGSENPQDNTIWGTQRVSTISSVGPCQPYTFYLNITAPATPGTYNFQWRMVQESVMWFGDFTPKLAIVVSSSAPTVTPTNTATNTPTPTVPVIDSEDYRIQYAGWRGASDAGANAETYRFSRLTNDKATWKFTGTSFTWLTRKGSDQGKARVTIDGLSKGTFDLYAPSLQRFQKTFGGLANKAHTITIRVLGTKNTQSTSTNVSLDAFVAGSRTSQDSSPSIQYNSWAGESNVNASGGTLRKSNFAGAKAYLTFTGTSVTFVSARGPGYGRVQVLIDGISKGTVDLYAAAQQWQWPQTYSGLTNGKHTVTIKVLGTKNVASKGYLVVVDAFTGPITTPGTGVPVESEEKDGSSADASWLFWLLPLSGIGLLIMRR